MQPYAIPDSLACMLPSLPHSACHIRSSAIRVATAHSQGDLGPHLQSRPDRRGSMVGWGRNVGLSTIILGASDHPVPSAYNLCARCGRCNNFNQDLITFQQIGSPVVLFSKVHEIDVCEELVDALMPRCKPVINFHQWVSHIKKFCLPSGSPTRPEEGIKYTSKEKSLENCATN